MHPDAKLPRDRCPECSGELSACGDMTADGPTMDCRQCQQADSIDRLQARLTSLAAERRLTQQILEDICKAVGYPEDWQAYFSTHPNGYTHSVSVATWAEDRLYSAKRVVEAVRVYQRCKEAFHSAKLCGSDGVAEEEMLTEAEKVLDTNLSSHLTWEGNDNDND